MHKTMESLPHLEPCTIKSMEPKNYFFLPQYFCKDTETDDFIIGEETHDKFISRRILPGMPGI